MVVAIFLGIALQPEILKLNIDGTGFMLNNYNSCSVTGEVAVILVGQHEIGHGYGKPWISMNGNKSILRLAK